MGTGTSEANFPRYQPINHTDSSVILEDCHQLNYLSPINERHKKKGKAAQNMLHMKSMQDTEYATVQVDLNDKSSFNKNIKRDGSKSMTRLKRSSNGNNSSTGLRGKSKDRIINEQLLFNQNQVAMISAKAREVSQKLLMMKNFEASLPGDKSPSSI